ncbi:MAG: hypothetical protein ACHREM_04475 [Polyangiales bacterium]
MWLQAAFSQKDLVVFAQNLFPVHLALEGGDERGRHLYLGKPRTLELVADQGLRVEMRARVRWPMLGINMPIDVPNVTALLRLKVMQRGGEDVFAFAPEIEALDVTHLPGFADDSLMKAINAEIAKDHDALTWRFTHTLDFQVPIPEVATPARRLHLVAKWGDVVVTKDGVQLVATFNAELSRRGEPIAVVGAAASAPVTAPVH